MLSIQLIIELQMKMELNISSKMPSTDQLEIVVMSNATTFEQTQRIILLL